ncbi:MAG: AAA family ATPase [Caldilineaceae bacterium]
MNGNPPDVLRGVVERITFHSEETGYTVAKLAPEQRPSHLPHWQNEVALVGTMLGVTVGESVEVRGRWTMHAEYGKQFSVETMRSVLPATVAGMEKYLGSGLVKGVGPVTAKRIVAHFGETTLDVIDSEVGRLIEVPGVGKKRVSLIRHAWEEQRAIKEVMIFLQGNGVSTSLATKIYKRYGDDSIAVVQADPYRLAQDIYGIGFLTADKIAQALGMALDSPQRIAAGVEYTLNQSTDEGHVFLPSQELIAQAAELLGVSREQAAAGVLHLRGGDRVKVAPTAGADAPNLGWAVTGVYGGDGSEVQLALAEQKAAYAAPPPDEVTAFLQEEQAVYLTPLYFGEVGVSNRLHRLLAPGISRFAHFQSWNWAQSFAEMEAETGFVLAEKQRLAVRSTLTHRLTILTGGPGTGKTTTVRTILRLCQATGRSALLAAPTGRAAKRLSETTGQEAKTIHRLLEFQPSEGMSFKRNEESPLAGDLLIVDEASMLDLILTNSLLKAVPPGMHLLLVGDVDQLPSVGAGNVLEDIIQAVEGTGERESGRAEERWTSAAVVRLDTIFRQAAGSFIIENAHRINRGQMPEMDAEKATDFFLFRTEEPERAAQLVVELVQERIPRRFAIPPQDIQVLSPMHRGVVGVAALNDAIQKAVNPPRPDRPERMVGSRIFRVGDRVMQIRNNYDKEVYNGDMGHITGLDAIEQQVVVSIDGKPVAYDFLELDELTHAYAVSVHKSQGSEFPVVVIPVLTTHYMMLQRNLLYTAVTRARRLVVLVGQPRAIGLAVRNNRVAARYTGLTERLVG